MGEIVDFPDFRPARTETPNSVCLGYDPEGKPIWAEINSGITLEGYILNSLNCNCFMALMVRFLGIKFFVGEYRAIADPDSLNSYFLFWCKAHHKYYVDCLRGGDRAEICSDCRLEKSGEAPIIIGPKIKKSARILQFPKK